MNGADTAWMLMSTALVLLMTPALGFFYGGLVRSKNALNTMMMSFVALGPVAVVWALLGYSLAFAPGNAVIGSLSYAGLQSKKRDALRRKGHASTNRQRAQRVGRTEAGAGEPRNGHRPEGWIDRRDVFVGNVLVRP